MKLIACLIGVCMLIMLGYSQTTPHSLVERIKITLELFCMGITGLLFAVLGIDIQPKITVINKVNDGLH